MINLFYFILFITFLSANVAKVINFLVKLVMGGPSKDYSVQREKLKEMTNELSNISMTDEWAKYAKLQRKITKEKDELSRLSSVAGERTSSAVSSLTKLLRLALGISLTGCVFFNRGEVVAQVPQNWLWPIHSLICWSRDVPGGITVPCWVIISSSVARSLSQLY